MAFTLKNHYDVVIVGGGPTGAAAANFLGKAGISTLIIDKEAKPSNQPKAVGMCDEGSRILDAIGILDDPNLSLHPINKVKFCDPLNHTLFYADTQSKVSGYPILRTFHQPDLEASLRRALTHCCHVDLATSTKLKHFEDSHSHLTLTLERKGHAYQVNCRYLLACDGAKSGIRKQLNLGFIGSSYEHHWAILDAEDCQETGDEVAFGILSDRPMVTLPGPDHKRRWEFMMKPNDSPASFLALSNLCGLVGHRMNRHEITISRTAIYTFHARYAQGFQQGRVFLLGDAAHVSPPFSGQGMMGGLRDVHNLCWKLISVLRGSLSEKLLKTYETERMPHSRQVILFAQVMGAVILPSNAYFNWIKRAVLQLMRLFGQAHQGAKLPIYKLPNHINGSLLKHLYKKRIFNTGIELPQCRVRCDGTSGFIDKWLSYDFYLLAWLKNPEDFMSQETRKRWQQMGGKIVLFGSAASPSMSQATPYLMDEEGIYHSLLNAGQRIILIRPDKMMALNVKAKKLDRRLNGYMDNIGCPPCDDFK